MWLLIYKLTRPTLPIASGLAAWIIAKFCAADANSALASATAIALSTLGASFYHFGAANWMHARKSDRLALKNPQTITLIALTIFCVSISISVLFLPPICTLICLFNTLAIAAYSVKLSNNWTTKNITMSVICTTPIVIGWLSGNNTHPIVIWAIAIAALAHFAREVVKDVKDIIANEGKRITLPMILGESEALQLAGVLLIISSLLPLGMIGFNANPFQTGLLVITACSLSIAGVCLFLIKKPWRWELVIHSSICAMLIAFI